MHTPLTVKWLAKHDLQIYSSYDGTGNKNVQLVLCVLPSANQIYLATSPVFAGCVMLQNYSLFSSTFFRNLQPCHNVVKEPTCTLPWQSNDWQSMTCKFIQATMELATKTCNLFCASYHPSSCHNVVKEPTCTLPWQSLALDQLKYLQNAVN